MVDGADTAPAWTKALMTQGAEHGHERDSAAAAAAAPAAAAAVAVAIIVGLDLSAQHTLEGLLKD